VVLEAMSSGLLAHTYDYAAGRQFIEDGRNGYLSEFDRPAAFIERTVEICGRPDDWNGLRKAARERAETVPWVETIDRFGTLLRGAVENDGGSEIGIVPASTSPTF